jgi:mannose-6-phosphate isomerase-like protein (cupin superfamily)
MPSGISEQFAHLVQPEHLDTIEVLGPTIQFLTSTADANAPCIMRGTIPPGVSIPLHSHGDPETFVMLSGTVDGLVIRHEDFEWTRINPGDVFHVPPHAKHAWRNQGQSDAVMVIVTTSRLGGFFQELGKPLKPGVSVTPPSQDEIRRFLKTAEKYGYWNATPEENARVGIRSV